MVLFPMYTILLVTLRSKRISLFTVVSFGFPHMSNMRRKQNRRFLLTLYVPNTQKNCVSRRTFISIAISIQQIHTGYHTHEQTKCHENQQILQLKKIRRRIYNQIAAHQLLFESFYSLFLYSIL